MNRFQAAKLKSEWKARFEKMLAEAQIEPFTTFSVSLRYWSRADADGCVAGMKVCIDQLRAMGLATNDDKRYMKGIWVHSDAALAHNTYELTIHVHPQG
jgi:hypothetical protein